MPAPHYPHHTVPGRTRVADYGGHHTTTGELHSRHKRRYPAEVQAAMEQFRRQFSAALADVRARLADNFDRPGVTDPVSLVSVVIDNEGDTIRARLRDGATDGVNAGARMAQRRFNLGVDFDQAPESAIRSVEAVVGSFEDDALNTVARSIEGDLKGWLEEGLSVDEMRDRILTESYQTVLDNRHTETHVRTIVQGAAERGNHEMMRQAPGVVGERWHATNDGRARESHLDAEGQIAPVEGTFLLVSSEGRAELLHPGDPNGPIHEIANCRCFATPVFADDLTDDEVAQLRAGRRLNV